MLHHDLAFVSVHLLSDRSLLRLEIGLEEFETFLGELVGLHFALEFGEVEAAEVDSIVEFLFEQVVELVAQVSLSPTAGILHEEEGGL